jgi:hypothetical protein
VFPRIYTDVACPLDGYEGYTFRVLANPTGAEKTDWAFGSLGDPDCADCKASKRAYCADCTTARDRMGRSASAIYGTSKAAGLDFSTPEASLASFSLAELPDELLAWLYMLPGALWAARSEDVKKKLPQFLVTGDSTNNSV